MSSRQIEMTWRCTSCGARNLGRYKSCQSCRNPKDGSEEYEMPEDPSKAASVTEESLLRMALAGPDWRCAYCESDQRAPDKSCANCGASALEGEEVPDAPEPSTPPPARGPNGLPMAPLERHGRHAPSDNERQDAVVAAESKRRWRGRILKLAGVGLGALVVLGAIGWNELRPRDWEARVTSVSWERSVAVERYHAKGFEGFKEDMPEGADSVRSLGTRFHHNDSVLDGYRTERYTVQVSDGYRTESYTERVACGETCSGSERSCSEKCTSNKNGFATCRTVCSGGGRSCRTKYCSESRTRQVPKTRTENRERQVPKYKDVPRYAEAFSWVAWVWEPNRTLRTSGHDVTVRWPDTRPPERLGPGEQEREQRTETYAVEFTYGDGREFKLAPTSEAEFLKYPPQSKHPLHTEDNVFTLDDVVVSPVR